MEDYNLRPSDDLAPAFVSLAASISLYIQPLNHETGHRKTIIHFDRRVVHGEQQTELTQNQAALDVQVVSRRPFFTALKAFPVMHSLGRRANPVQLRVRAPFRNRSEERRVGKECRSRW